jgi:hypothetical protein
MKFIAKEVSLLYCLPYEQATIIRKICGSYDQKIDRRSVEAHAVQWQ